MRNFLWVVGAILATIAIVLMTKSFGMAGASSSATPRPAALLPEATQESTVTPEPTMIPTIDYSSSWPALTQASAAGDLAVAQAHMANSAATVASSAATQVEATQQGYIAALMPGTPTAIARATEQAQATVSALATADNARQKQAFVIAQNDAEARHAEELAKITTEQNVKTAGIVILATVFIGIILLIVRAVELRQWSASMSEFNIPDSDFRDAPPPEGFTKIQTSSSPNEAFQWDVPITRAEIHQLRRAYNDLGGHLVEATITAGKYFTQLRWRQIYQALIAHGPDGTQLATPTGLNGALVFSPAGYDFLGITPPPVVADPKTQQNPVSTQRNVTQLGGGVDATRDA